MNPCPCCAGRDVGGLMDLCRACFAAYADGGSETCHATVPRTRARRSWPERLPYALRRRAGAGGTP